MMTRLIQRNWYPIIIKRSRLKDLELYYSINQVKTHEYKPTSVFTSADVNMCGPFLLITGLLVLQLMP